VSRATVPPIADAARPRWSVMIPTYNCARYLDTALRSVLAQDPGPEAMQIEVVDDHSTADDPEDVVMRLGGGRVAFHRQPENIGVVGNLNTCLQRSRGELVHLLHGDDLILEGFYRTLDDDLREHAEAGAAYCRHLYVDERDRRLDVAPLEPASSGILMEGARFLAAEQRIMTLHENSNTGRNLREGRSLEYTRLAIELFATYFEPAERRAVTRNAFSRYATSGLETARRLQSQGDAAAARAQLRVVWRLDKSPRTAAGIARVIAGSLARRVTNGSQVAQ
jgi:glycosyltransferase involved in cell wall biosynthesis